MDVKNLEKYRLIFMNSHKIIPYDSYKEAYAAYQDFWKNGKRDVRFLEPHEIILLETQLLHVAYNESPTRFAPVVLGVTPTKNTKDCCLFYSVQVPSSAKVLFVGVAISSYGSIESGHFDYSTAIDRDWET